MVNGTLLNFGKRYDNNFRVIFDQWLKLHLGLDVLSNQEILKGVFLICTTQLPINYQFQKLTFCIVVDKMNTGYLN